MLAKVLSSALHGIHAIPVPVEVAIPPCLPPLRRPVVLAKTPPTPDVLPGRRRDPRGGGRWPRGG